MVRVGDVKKEGRISFPLFFLQGILCLVIRTYEVILSGEW